MPEISVVMGIYNENRKYAARAIDSILQQTFTDFELLICDDGSDVSFYSWLRDYCRKDSRIKLMRHRKNKGLAAALNQCLRRASGTFIARMDADDISIAVRFEKQAAFLKQHKEYAMVGCSVYLISGQTIWGERRLEEMPQKESFLKTSPFVHPAVMIRREVMQKLRGYREQPQYMRVEDYDFFMRMYAAGHRGYNLREALLIYRDEQRFHVKRKYRFRWNELRVRMYGFSKLGISAGNLHYVIKPLAVGLIPHRMKWKLHTKQYAFKSFDICDKKNEE